MKGAVRDQSSAAAKAWQITTSEKLSPECIPTFDQSENYVQVFTNINDDSKWTNMNQMNHMWWTERTILQKIDDKRDLRL